MGNITVVTCDVSNDRGALDVVKDNDRICSVEISVLNFILLLSSSLHSLVFIPYLTSLNTLY